MKLFWTPASPFVRKVMVVVHELGLTDQVEIAPTVWPHEWGTKTVAFDPDFIAANPVGRIPALVTDEGVALCESNIICRYLATRGPENSVVPGERPEDLPLLRLWGIADGALEAMIATRAETLRTGPVRSDDFIRKQLDRVVRCIDSFDLDVLEADGEVTIAHISAAIVCGYLDFRYPDETWRPGRERLANWADRFCQRPSMQATLPAETPQK